MLSYDPLVANLLEAWTQHYLVGKDPMAHELHWMRMHQDNADRGGRLFSTALSGIDIALWDLKGKALGVPVYHCSEAHPRQDQGLCQRLVHQPRLPRTERRRSPPRRRDGLHRHEVRPLRPAQLLHHLPEEAQIAEDRVAAVREAVGPNVEILVEVHAKFNVHTAIHLGSVWRSTAPSGSRNPSPRKTSARWPRSASTSTSP